MFSILAEYIITIIARAAAERSHDPRANKWNEI